MSKFNKLSRAEMKNVMGGLVNPGDCIKSECSSDSDCTTTNPHCYKETCNSTGKEVTYCGKNPSA
jgi:hypothetical protein